MNNQIRILIFAVSFLILGSMFVPALMDTETRTEEKSSEIQSESNPFVLEPIDIEDENVEIPIITPFDQSGTATRSSSRESPDYGDSYTAAQDLGTSFPTTISGGRIDGPSDEDWFKLRLTGDDGTGSNVENVSIKPSTSTSLSTDGYWWWGNVIFQIYIFGEYDYGGPFDSNKLVFMDAKGFRPWSQYSSEWDPAFSRAYKTGTYYIMTKADFGSGSYVSYTLDVDVKSITPEDRNQVGESGDQPVKDKKYKVEMDRDLFDWYKLTSPTGQSYPYNFSFSFELTSSPSVWSDTDHFTGKTVHFYCEAIIVVFHDLAKNPIGIYKVSNSNLFNMNKTKVFIENTTEPVSYVGVYVQMYGRTENGDGPYYFIEHGNNGEKYMGGFAEYRFNFISTQYIIQSVLLNEQVTPYRGRTYHDYTFSVMYVDENNKAPLLSQIKIDNRPIEEMTLVSFNSSLEDDYKHGAYFEYSINGVKLGEGIHKYRFYFKDPDGFSIRALMDFTGPHINDNVEPQIRVTAEDEIQVMEDSGIRYVNLLEIFDDVENDPIEFTLKQGSNWVKSYETDKASYSIRSSNNTLRITPKTNAYGKDKVYLNASDDKGNWVETPFEYTVDIVPVNDPPQIKKYLGEWRINEDSKLIGINLNDYFYDPIEPEQTLEYDYEQVDNIEIVLDALGENVIITPDENWNGEASIRFSAFDGYDTIYNVLRLNVVSINDLPEFKNPKGFTINEGTWFQLNMTAYDPVEGQAVHIETNITDEVNSQLLRTKRIVSPAFGGVIEGKNLIIEKDPKNSSRHTLRFKPTNEMAGSSGTSFTGIYYINISAVDTGGARVTHNVIMTIMNVNNAPNPVINRPLNGSTYYDDELVYFFGDAGDPDSIHGGHNFYTWSSNINGELGSTKYVGPVTLSEGLHTITLEVGDGENIGRAEIQLRIRHRMLDDTTGGGRTEEAEVLGISSSDAPMYIMIIAIIVLAVLAVLAVALTIINKKAAIEKMKSDIPTDQLKLPEEVQKLLAPQKAICAHCGSVISVVSKRRPISVTCTECGKKSILYHPGHSVIEQFTGEERREPGQLEQMPDRPALPPGPQS